MYIEIAAERSVLYYTARSESRVDTEKKGSPKIYSAPS